MRAAVGELFSEALCVNSVNADVPERPQRTAAELRNVRAAVSPRSTRLIGSVEEKPARNI